MINDDFLEFLKLIKLSNIQIIDSHETVKAIFPIGDGEEIQINTEQGINKEDPIIKNNIVSFQLRYNFSFTVKQKEYFRAEYVVLVSFAVENIDRFRELFSKQEIKDIFYSKQLNRTLWTILRGTVMDAFNRHSLKPVILPFVL